MGFYTLFAKVVLSFLAIFAFLALSLGSLPQPPEEDIVLKGPIVNGLPLLLLSKMTEVPIVRDLFALGIKQINRISSSTMEFSTTLGNKEPLHFPLSYPADALLAEAREYAQETPKEIAWSEAIFDIAESDWDGVAPKTNPFRTSLSYVNAYLSGETTPTQAMQRLVETYSITNDRLSFPLSQVYKDDIMRQARESTERYKNHKPLSRLDGVPMVVKDDLQVLGFLHTRGTNFLPHDGQKSKVDEDAIARMRQAGVIIFGSTAMHELGIGVVGLFLLHVHITSL